MESYCSEYAKAWLQDMIVRFNSLVIDGASQRASFNVEEALTNLKCNLSRADVLFGNLLTTRKTWQLWGDLIRVCYDAEDLVDDLELDSIYSISVFQRVFQRSPAGKIQELQQKLEAILTTGQEMVNNTNQQADECDLRKSVYREQVPPPEKSFGRDLDKDNIVTLLLQETTRPISIIGMGGLGKTTLAHNIYNDVRIIDKFDHIKWVSVSATFDYRSIKDCIYKAFPAKGTRSLNHVLEAGESILIVLDDLWDVKHTEWHLFRTCFSGCQVLFTTHNSNVASITEAIPYHLQVMSDEDCRDLILERVRALHHSTLSNRQRVCMEEVVGAMALKCKGLPLAAHVLGLFLCSQFAEDNWMTLLRRDIYALKPFKQEIFPAFRLHNPDLGSHLTKCLAYCSLFPHNYDFTRDCLVQLWMAEGFVQPQGVTGLMDIGSEYFDELYWRSIFQLSNLHEQKPPIYRIHEYIHRYAEIVASDVYLRLEEGKCSHSTNWYKKARHLSLICQNLQQFLKEIEKCEGLRTFLLPGDNAKELGKVPYQLFQKLGRLRVLDLSNTDIDELPESLGRLKQLGYLDASKTPIQMLPESISNLVRLQVLKLRDCSKLIELPTNLKTLTNLLNLDVYMTTLKCMPANMGNLIHLQTLQKFIVGKKEGYRITELKNMNSLKGTICLINLENVKDCIEAKEARLSNKTYIKRLELQWCSNSRNALKDFEVFEELEPDKNLEELEITNYGGPGFPTWLTNPSNRFVSIYLKDCSQVHTLPSLGQLPFLETLHIEGLCNVIYVNSQFCGEANRNAAFPALKTLKIKHMELLIMWLKLPVNNMPNLCELSIENCQKLTKVQSLKHMTSLQTLEIRDCSVLWMPLLPISVQSLVILRSNRVKRQCQPEDGPEWQMIKNIPKIEIDYDVQIASPGGPN